MNYTVITRTRTNKTELERVVFDTLEEAIKEAGFASYSGSQPVEIVVMDDVGTELSVRIFDNP